MKPNFKPIPPDESSLCNVIYQENKKQFDYPWHYHEEYELTYISNGRGIRYVGSSIENFSDDDLVLLGSNLPHCWINETDDRKQSPNAVVIYLKDGFFNNTWIRSHEFKSIRNMLELSAKGIKFCQPVVSKIKKGAWIWLNYHHFKNFFC